MRFTKLTLAKFGMFTDTDLDLLPEGVNVVVGANEAGKTTTMAAIHQLLYGIPTRSPHSYLHSNSDLRIGATMRENDGVELEVFRIKRNNASLISPSDQPIAEETMARLLGGVGPEAYRTIFSISHEEIVSGGEALLKGEGELGRALLAAGTGLTQLNSTMAKINAKVGELFKPSASKPLINEAIARFRDSKAQIREHSQSASAAESVEAKLKDAEGLEKRLESRYKELIEELNLTRRIRQVRVPMERRRNLKRNLLELTEEGPLASEAIATQLKSAQEDRREGNSTLASFQADLESLDEKLTRLQFDEALVAQAPEIEGLVKEVGAIKQNLTDLPGLNKKVGDLERSLEALLARVPEGCRRGPDGIPQLSDVERSRIRRLSDDSTLVKDALERSRTDLVNTKYLHNQLADELKEVPHAIDVSNLRSAIARIRQEGQLESTLDDLKKQIADSLVTTSAELASLGVNIEVRSADSVPLPTLGSVNEFDRIVVETKSAYDIAVAELNRHEADLAELNEKLKAHQLLLDPPSAEQLATARTLRDQGWKIIKELWLEGSTDQLPAEAWSRGLPLDRAYEDSVKGADEIADRLRHEAEAVERQVTLKGQISAEELSIEAAQSTLESAKGNHSDALDRWRNLWEPYGIEAGSRQSMDEFLLNMRAISEGVSRLKVLESQAGSLEETIERSKVDIRLLLNEVGDQPPGSLSLAGLLARAEETCYSSDEVREKRLLLERSLQESQKTLERQEASFQRAVEDHDNWSVQWSEAVVPLGIPADTLPADVSDLLSTIQEIEDISLDLKEQRLRVSGIEHRNLKIEDSLHVVLRVLPHLGIEESNTEVAINALQARLTIAQSTAATQKALLEQRSEKADDFDRISRSVIQAEALIKWLVSESGFDDESSLVEAIERTDRVKQLEAEVGEIEDDLIAAHGIPLDQLAREVESFADVDIDAKIEQLNSRREECEGERNMVAQEIGGLRAQKNSINDSDEAAFEAERAQLILSEIGNHSDEYVRLTLAKYLLEQEISDYRSKNQGPILNRASEIFSRITIGRYAGIETDIDDKNQLIILAKTSSGKSLDVKALSTGTRDQLYLSLRLAGLENYATGTRNLPLLLDDLFVHFDDARTKAGLAIIEEMCSKLQVILFTHHGQVVDQARDTISKERLRIQVLTR